MSSLLYLGLTEFTLWSTATRLVAASVLVTLVHRALFAHRPALPLVMSLSLPAGLTAGARRAYAQARSGQTAQVFLVLALTVMAATATIADFTLSSIFGSLRADREARIVWARPSDPTKRPMISTALTGQLASRDLVYGALRSMMPDNLNPDRDWLRTGGSLDEVDTTLALLHPGLCGLAPNKPSPFDVSRMVTGNSRILPEYLTFDPRGDVTAGTQQLFVNLMLVPTDNGTAQVDVTTIAIPVPIRSSVNSEGQLQGSTDRSDGALEQRQFSYGVSSTSNRITAYNMTCGLAPDDVRTWLNARLRGPKPTVAPFVGYGKSGGSGYINPSTMYYSDISNYRSFGGTFGGFAAGISIFSQRVPANDSMPLLTYLAGAQVCRSQLTVFKASLTGPYTALRGASSGDAISDLIGTVRIVPQSRPHSVRCINDAAVKSKSQPTLWTTLLSRVRSTVFNSNSSDAGADLGGGWATTYLTPANTGGWAQQAQAVKTYELPAGPQMFVQTVIGVYVWELILSFAAAAAVLVLSMGFGWGDQHTAPLALMYDFDYVPNAARPDPPADLRHGVEGIDLLQPTKLVAVELATVPRSRVLRVVPAASSETTLQAARWEAGAGEGEIVATAASVGEIQQALRERYPLNRENKDVEDGLLGQDSRA
ncbi:hypothetical protein H9P43_005643 [Blastocladiella emersonii ATCC 22665]|nr:hypothetical protein H9P43_005643 [Blastocladiella emersonii ATCC 22665]